MGFQRASVFSAILAGALAMSQVALAEPVKIVGFGDSLMAGYGLGNDQGFTARLENALRGRGLEVSVANAGVSGDTTSGGLARLDWSVPDGTELVILELGANDMLRGVAPALTEKNLDQMLAKLKQRGIPAILMGMRAAPNLGTRYQADFDGIFPRLAKKYDVPLYPFFLDGVTGDRRFLLEDGMHPNAAGVDRMVERVLPVVEKSVRAQANS